MIDPTADDPPGQLIAKLDSWRAQLKAIREQAPELMRLMELVVSTGDRAEDVHPSLNALVEAADEGRRVVRDIVEHERVLAIERHARIRWEPAGIEASLDKVRRAFEVESKRGVDLWVESLFDAIECGQPEAMTAIATAELPWPPALQDGLARMREVLGRPPTDRDAMWEFATMIADDQVEGWKVRWRLDTVVRAHRLAAWAALRMRDDPQTAFARLNAATETKYQKAAVHAAYAEYFLHQNELDRAVVEPRRSGPSSAR